MNDDLIPFLAGVGFLIIYLVLSASTEMFTKLPAFLQPKDRDR